MKWARALLAFKAFSPFTTPAPAPHRAEGVESVGVVRIKRTVAVAEFAFALPALVSSASGGVCSGAACG